MMKNRTLELDALRAFVAIADCGGFSIAAGQLGRSQSAISLQIKRLEQTLGQTLLHRVQGRVDGLTAEGNGLLVYARQMLRLNDEACSVLGQNTGSGRLRIGFPEELMDGLFSEVVTRFRSLYPRLSLFVQADTSAVLQAALADGALDAVLIKSCGELCPESSEVLFEEPLCWMIGERFRDTLAAEAGEVIPLALFGQNCVFRLAASTALAQAGFACSVRYSGGSTSGLRHAVRQGLGLTLLPRSYLSEGLVLIDQIAGQTLPALPQARLLALFAAGERAPATLAFVDAAKRVLRSTPEKS